MFSLWQEKQAFFRVDDLLQSRYHIYVQIRDETYMMLVGMEPWIK